MSHEAELAETVTALSRMTPNLSATPGVLYGAATSANPVATAQAAAGYQQVMTLWRSLVELEDTEQLIAYSGLQETQRQMLTQVGYLPPHERAENRAWWEKALEGIGKGVETVAAGVVGAAEGFLLGASAGAAAGSVIPGIGTIAAGIAGGLGGATVQGFRGVKESLEGEGLLEIASMPIDDITRLYRASDIAFQGIRDESGSIGQWAPWNWGPSHFAEGWRRVNDDIPDFTRPPAQILNDLGLKLDPVRVLIAADLAAETPEIELFSRYGVAETLDALEDPEFNQSVEALRQEQLSWGRSLARSLLGSPSEVTETGEVVTKTAFKMVSGTADGLLWWFGDPLNRPLGLFLKGRKAAQIVARSVQSAEDIPRLMKLPGVMRATQRIATLFAEHGDTAAARIAQEFPRMPPEFLQSLARVAPKTLDEAVDFLSGEAGLLGIVQGRYAGYRGVWPQAPFLTKSATIRHAISTKIIDGFETLEQVGLGPLGAPARGTGRAFRRLVNLVPAGRGIKPFDPGSIETFRRIAKFSLPRHQAEKLTSIWIAAPDEAAKRVIYEGMVLDVFRAAGSSGNKALDDAGLKIVKKLTDSLGNSTYATDGGEVISKRFTREGIERGHAGVTMSDMAQEWPIPNFREIVRLKRQAALWGRVGPHIPEGVLDHNLERIWKPAVLWRLGFAFRNGIEEAFNFVAAKSGLSYLQNFTGARLVRNAKRWDEIVKAYALKGDEVKLVEWIAWRARQAKHAAGTPIRKVGGKLAGERYLAAAAVAYREYGTRMVPDGISSGYDHAGKIVANRPETLARSVRTSEMGREVRVTAKPTGSVAKYGPSDQFQTLSWHGQLARHVEDREMLIAWEHLDDFDTAVDEVAAYLASDEAGYLRSLAERSRLMNDGRVVGVDATEAEAYREWADIIVRNARSLVTGQHADRLDDVLGAVRQGKVPDFDDLLDIEEALRPAAVIGDEMVLVAKSGQAWDWLVAKGFAPLERMIDHISRQPIYVAHLADALDEVAPMVREWTKYGMKNARELGERRALDIAAQRTIAHIDQAATRSQFAVMYRQIIPFWHAQEQFIKRWAKVMIHNPNAVRRAQLTMEGLRHSGMIEKDDQGDLIFKVPGMMWGFNVLKQVAPLIFGSPVAEGVVFEFSGKLKYLFAGTDSPRGALVPSTSPIVSIPLQFLAHRMPFFEGARNVIEGSDHYDKPVWEQLFPSWAVKAIRAGYEEENEQGQFASAYSQAAQFLQATGHGIPETADAHEQQVFKERVEATARTILMMRSILGFVGTTPSFEFADNLQPEFRKFLRNHDYPEAFAAYLEKHPDASPWTVFSTRPASIGAPVVPGEAAAQWITENEAFVDKYGAPAAWLMPGAPAKFNLDAWLLEQAHGLRIRRTAFATDPNKIDGIWEQIHIRAAQDYYFTLQDRKDVLLDTLVDSVQRQNVRDIWSKFVADYRAAHPIFARWQDQGQARAGERFASIETIRTMLDDPASPTSPHVGALREVITTWDTYNRLVGQLGTSDSDYALKTQIKLRFKTWGAALLDPVARQMFSALIDPLIRGDLDG